MYVPCLLRQLRDCIAEHIDCAPKIGRLFEQFPCAPHQLLCVVGGRALRCSPGMIFHRQPP